jgi:hypothetical protein
VKVSTRSEQGSARDQGQDQHKIRARLSAGSSPGSEIVQGYDKASSQTEIFLGSKIPDRDRNLLGHFGLFWPRPVE